MKTPAQLIRSLVAVALERSTDLPIHERADLFEAAALILNGDEAAEASATACLLRDADKAQLQFRSLLSK